VRIAVLGLFAAWIAVFGVATILVALQEELTLTSSVTAVAATLNDVGSGLGQVGATESFEIVNPFGRVVLTACSSGGSRSFRSWPCSRRRSGRGERTAIEIAELLRINLLW
jgi:hypothetical protein